MDRLDRRRVLIATQSLLTGFSFVLYLLIASHQIAFWSILVLSSGSGLVNALDGPARQIYVLDLVGRRRPASAVSLYGVILNSSRVLGPALGGVMLALYGPGACVLTNTFSFLAPLAVLLLHRAGATVPEPAAAPPAGRGARRGATRAGLRYAWSVPAVFPALISDRVEPAALRRARVWQKAGFTALARPTVVDTGNRVVGAYRGTPVVGLRRAGYLRRKHELYFPQPD